MTIHSSSDDLHPRSGARFVFVRDESAQDPQYRVAIHLAGGRTIEGRLEWRDGRGTLDDDIDVGPGEDAMVDWARTEALKLARAVRASGQARLTRWRGPPAPSAK